MAQAMIGTGFDFGFVNVKHTKAGSAAASGTDITTPLNYTSITAIDTRLNTFNATLYPQTTLDKMSLNDKIYALRQADDPTSIK